MLVMIRVSPVRLKAKLPALSIVAMDGRVLRWCSQIDISGPSRLVVEGESAWIETSLSNLEPMGTLEMLDAVPQLSSLHADPNTHRSHR